MDKESNVEVPKELIRPTMAGLGLVLRMRVLIP